MGKKFKYFISAASFLLVMIAIPDSACADYISRWVALGDIGFDDPATNTIAYSDDGINWNGAGNDIFDWAYGVAWNGSKFVAVGVGSNTIAYSTDGINWTGLGADVIDDMGNGVAWNGSKFVAVGSGTNTIAYSTDGINWTGLGATVFDDMGIGVAWNGGKFVAVGSGTNTIAYSEDGINWTGLGSSILTSQGNGVAWNGSRFVAVGAGTNTIAYSTDGINWTGIGKDIFTIQGYAVAWDGSKFVAVGAGTNTIAYSTDGINWTGLGNAVFEDFSQGVAWNGSKFVAVGSGTNTIAYSLDGINWTGLGDDVLMYGYAVAAAPSPELVPAVAGIYVAGDAPAISGLSNDETPKKSKTWTWSSGEGTLFRYSVDQNATSTLSGDYSDLTSATKSSGEGTWYLHVQAKDSGDDESEVVNVSAILDNTAPIITVIGDNPKTVPYGSVYEDEGASATDNIDGEIAVDSSGEVDTDDAGEYTVTYTATDVAGNAATAIRTVNVSAPRSSRPVSGQYSSKSGTPVMVVANDRARIMSQITSIKQQLIILIEQLIVELQKELAAIRYNG